MSEFVSNRARLAQNGRNLGLFKISFVCILSPISANSYIWWKISVSFWIFCCSFRATWEATWCLLFLVGSCFTEDHWSSPLDRQSKLFYLSWFYIYLNLVDLNIWVIGCFIIINILIKFQKLWTQYESYEFLRLMDKDSYMSPQLLEIFLLWRGCNTWLTFGFSERWVIPL